MTRRVFRRNVIRREQDGEFVLLCYFWKIKRLFGKRREKVGGSEWRGDDVVWRSFRVAETPDTSHKANYNANFTFCLLLRLIYRISPSLDPIANHSIYVLYSKVFLTLKINKTQIPPTNYLQTIFRKSLGLESKT